MHLPSHLCATRRPGRLRSRGDASPSPQCASKQGTGWPPRSPSPTGPPPPPPPPSLLHALRGTPRMDPYALPQRDALPALFRLGKERIAVCSRRGLREAHAERRHIRPPPLISHAACPPSPPTSGPPPSHTLPGPRDSLCGCSADAVPPPLGKVPLGARLPNFRAHFRAQRCCRNAPVTADAPPQAPATAAGQLGRVRHPAWRPPFIAK